MIDNEHAARVQDAVAALNEALLCAVRSGLTVDVRVERMGQLSSSPRGYSVVEVRVARPL